MDKVKTAESVPLIRECEAASQLLKALAHPQRLQILCYLSTGEKSVGGLEKFCGASQSAVSQFLTRMKAEQLVSSRKEGHFVFYRIADPKVLKLVKAMHKIFCRKGV